MILRLGPLVLTDPMCVVSSIQSTSQGIDVTGVLTAPYTGTGQAALLAARDGLLGLGPLEGQDAGYTINFACDIDPRQDGWYRATDVSVDIGPGGFAADGEAGWVWQISLRREGHAGCATESVIYGGARPEVEAWMGVGVAGLRREWWASPRGNFARRPSGLSTGTRNGPGTPIAIQVGVTDPGSSSLYTARPILTPVSPSEWWVGGSMATDSAGRPITAVGASLPAGWELTNGICSVYWDGGLRLRIPSSTSTWEPAGRLVSLYGHPTSTSATYHMANVDRAVLVRQGPEVAIVRLSLRSNASASYLMDMDLILRRGDRGVVTVGVGDPSARWSWVAPGTLTGVGVGLWVVGHRTTEGSGNQVLIGPGAASTATGSRVALDASSTRLVTYIAGIYNGSSATEIDSAAQLIRMWCGEGAETVRVVS